MQFIVYCFNRHQEAKLREAESEMKEKIDVIADAEMKALSMARKWQTSFLKWLMIPVILFGYILVCLKLKREPRPVLLDKIKEQRSAEAEAKRVVEQLKKNQSSAEELPAPSISS